MSLPQGWGVGWDAIETPSRNRHRGAFQASEEGSVRAVVYTRPHPATEQVTFLASC